MRLLSSAASPRVKYIVLALFFSVSFVAFDVVVLQSPEGLFYWREYKQADAVIAKVESFRHDRGRLPESLAEVGIQDPEPTGVFYQRDTGDRYIVWFGTTLGESEVYQSDQRKWQ